MDVPAPNNTGLDLEIYIPAAGINDDDNCAACAFTLKPRARRVAQTPGGQDAELVMALWTVIWCPGPTNCAGRGRRWPFAPPSGTVLPQRFARAVYTQLLLTVL